MVSEKLRVICGFLRTTRSRKRNLSYKHISLLSVSRELVLWCMPFLPAEFQSSDICKGRIKTSKNYLELFLKVDMNVLIQKVFLFFSRVP